MYVYLSGDRSYVFLPTAVALQPSTADDPTASFADARGTIVAIFHRRDVYMYSRSEIESPIEGPNGNSP